MKLWLLSQRENGGYDTFDSCLVAAETADDARTIHPYDSEGYETWGRIDGVWANTPDVVSVTPIGTALEGTARGVIIASFNAG